MSEIQGRPERACNQCAVDALTGLYNRAKSLEECNQILLGQPATIFAMVHFDVQRFRMYNSFFGEEEGDRLLLYIADVLREQSSHYHFAVYGRIEADVFLLFLPYEAEKMASWIKTMEESLLQYRDDFQLIGNFGIYVIRDRRYSAETMFTFASLAAKNNANRLNHPVAFFDQKMEQQLQSDQELARDMQTALDQEQFQVYLQPKYNLKTGECSGAEVLVRWYHPQRGIVCPGDFIPQFESNGFIIALDQYMWEHSCQLLRKWLDAGCCPAPIAVNVSRVSIYRPQIVQHFKQLIEKYDIPVNLLQLELTESAYMENPIEIKERLTELRQAGFSILMDDFGSGYSSLNTLLELPVDYLKIDRAFLFHIDQDKRSQMILSAAVQMANSIDLPVVIEGVETIEQKEFVIRIGCDYVQGFLYARPMPVADYEKKILGQASPWVCEERPEGAGASDDTIQAEPDYMISINQVNEGIAVFRYGMQGACLEYANQALCSMLHLQLSDLLGKDYEALLTMHHQDNVDAFWQMILTLPEAKQGSCSYRIQDSQTGEEKWIAVQGLYRHEKRGDTASFVYMDITELKEAVEREQKLSQCIQLITDEDNFQANIQEMMECLREQYKADRAYIFNFDWENGLMHNSYEVTAEQVTPEKENLQNLEIDIVSYWVPKFQKGHAVFIDDLEQIKKDPMRQDEYQVLVVQDIHSLMVVPIRIKGELYGYLGVDNPHENRKDREFLNNIAYMLAQEKFGREQQKKLLELSLQDSLTGINNRHAFNNKVEELAKLSYFGLGVLFADVNGLKYTNDHYGHVAGDKLIIRVTEILLQYFCKEDLFRISGDEFVAVVPDVEEQVFHEKIQQMKRDVCDVYGSLFSIGEDWEQQPKDFDEMISRAEENMYEEKKLFYASHPNKSRRKNDE